MTVTEVIYVTLRSGDHDLANDEAHQEMVHFLVKQSPAVHSLAWGKTIEDSAKVLYFVGGFGSRRSINITFIEQQCPRVHKCESHRGI